jgi:predicted nucleic acid-binding protein
MRVVDTSAWIEWLIGSDVGVAVAIDLPELDQWLVPTIVQFELAKWVAREGGEKRSDQVIGYTETCVVVELDTSTALVAADLSVRHKLAMVDSIIYATALAHSAELLTCDRHFEGLPGVRFVPNPKAVKPSLN